MLACLSNECIFRSESNETENDTLQSLINDLPLIYDRF